MEEINNNYRKIPITDLVRRKNYLDLVPRPTPEEYQQLKDDIAQNGLDPTYPVVVNEDSMVLVDGYTRVQIAEELGIQEVSVIFREFRDHLEEKLFVLKSTLKRRHLIMAQKAALYVQVLAVEEEMARARQRQAGDRNLKQNAKSQKLSGDSKISPVDLNSGQPEKKGRAAKIVAANATIGHDTLSKAKKIIVTAQTDPEIADAWDKAQQGQGSVNSVYQQVKEKEEQTKPKVVFTKVKSWNEQKEDHLKRLEAENQALQTPREELEKTFREAARLKMLPMNAVEALMEQDPQFLQVWNHMRIGLVTLTVGWSVIYWKLHVWLRAQKGMEPDSEYRRIIYQEGKKSYLIHLFQLTMHLLKVVKVPELLVSLITGVDEKLFPYILSWPDRLDLLAGQVRLRSRIRPEIAEKARQLMQKGKEEESRQLITMSLIGDFRKKLENEGVLDRQRYGRN